MKNRKNISIKNELLNYFTGCLIGGGIAFDICGHGWGVSMAIFAVLLNLILSD